MSHVKLGATNDANAQTAIRARGDFISFDSVFKADGNTGEVVNKVVGLEGIGKNGGAGVSGLGGSPSPIKEPRIAGPGVMGRGGPVDNDKPGLLGQGVVGLGSSASDFHPEDSPGVGVFGAGSVGVYGLADSTGPKTDQNQFSTGVLGVWGTPQLVDPKLVSGIGVVGFSDGGSGVLGWAGGLSQPGTRGPAGVVGDSANGPGGSFSSFQQAQIHLSPSKDAMLPTVGIRGDLWAHLSPKVSRPGKKTKFQESSVSLYLCVEDFPEVRWQRVLLDNARLKGGAVVP